MSYGYRACPECGAVQRAALDEGLHTCDPDRREAHQLVQARSGLERLEQDLAQYLRTPRGRFDQYLARRGAVA